MKWILIVKRYTVCLLFFRISMKCLLLKIIFRQSHFSLNFEYLDTIGISAIFRHLLLVADFLKDIHTVGIIRYLVQIQNPCSLLLVVSHVIKHIYASYWTYVFMSLKMKLLWKQFMFTALYEYISWRLSLIFPLLVNCGDISRK